MHVNDPNKIDDLFWKITLKDDNEAFRILFFEFFSALCVFAHKYIERWDVCEDIVQDTFFKVWKNRKKIEIHVSGRNFLITSVRNSCIDYLRKQETERSWKEKEIVEKTDYSTEELYSTIELENILKIALTRLPENIRLAFEKNRFDGKTYAEIAKEQCISVKTVESYITKALRILRVELRDYLPLLLLFL